MLEAVLVWLSMVEFTENRPKTFKIKLKFSKGENEEEEEDQKIVGDDNLDNQKRIQNTEKVCEVCNKVFGSGKALGGHMRIHFQTHKTEISKESKKKRFIAQQSIKLEKFKNSSNGLDRFGSDEPSCALCRKIFPSMKSLFGHMRCHPEREWRGIHPPPSPRLPTKKSTFSWSTNSNTEQIDDDDDDDDDENEYDNGDDDDDDDNCDDDDDDDDDGLVGIDELVEPVNSMEVLPKWSVTAKRRRKAANVVVDDVEDEFREGVDYLMMLSKGTGDSSDRYSSNLAQKHQKGHSSEVINRDSVGNTKVFGLFDEDHHHTLMKNELVKGSNDGVISNTALMKSGTCKINVVESDELKKCEDSLIGKKGLIIKSKKERKKMKLIRDLDQIQDNSPPLIIHHTPPPQIMASPSALATAAIPEKYKCSICGKCFPTHQALGGHKSSHNKFKMFIHNSIDDHQLDSPPSATHTGSSAKKVMKRKKESKESDEGVGTQQHHQYQSKVCNKIFHLGQTLDGPKRSPWDSNTSPIDVEAQSISIQDKVVSHTNTGRVLDFDLNEPPPVEE